MPIPIIEKNLFLNKQNIQWNLVENYLKNYIGQIYVVELYHDKIHIGSDFPDEYTESGYTKGLRGAIAKVKANAVQIIDKIIMNAENRRWLENKNPKHEKNASEGWYRYDTYFGTLVKGSNEENERLNYYKATLIVRKTTKGLFLYDIVNIKKEASTPFKSEETVR